MKRYALGCFIVGAMLTSFSLWLSLDIGSTVAQEEVASAAVTGDDSYCTVCHTDSTSQVHTFADGSTIAVSVDRATLADSVHGTSNEEGALGCVDCHGAVQFPHDEQTFANQRAYTITAANVCIDCHVEQSENLADDVHLHALYDDNLRSATCVDCHGAHDVQPPAENPVNVSQTCGECHQIAYSQYAESVHGAALLAGDTNVPTCVDCHGVHGIQHPTTALFRNRSPQLCEDCHADVELMQQYDISTNVFNSYLTDFHGTTVQLFEQNDPNVPTNKAVCIDCHGAHNILASDNEKSQVVRENLLTTCRECHPNATSDFPASWVGHYEPTFETHPFLTAVNIFYAILIPVVLGGFIVFVATDIIRMIRQRFGN